MKIIPVLSAIVLFVCVSQMSLATGNTAWNVGVRQHAAQPDFPDISFGDDILSYGISMSAYDAGGYWEAGILYTPEIDGIDDMDYALTPQLNLVMTENFWRMGLGGARTYVNGDGDDSGWRDFFWQMIIGLGLPGVGSANLEVRAIYIFDDWGDIGDFDTDNLEYALWIGIPF